MSDKLFRTLTIGGVTYTLNDTTKLEKPIVEGTEGQVLTYTAEGPVWSESKGKDAILNCTAWEVYPTDHVIPAKSSEIGIAVFNDESLVTSVDIAASMTEEFTLWLTSKLKDSDIQIDWGDGDVLTLNNSIYVLAGIVDTVSNTFKLNATATAISPVIDQIYFNTNSRKFYQYGENGYIEIAEPSQYMLGTSLDLEDSENVVALKHTYNVANKVYTIKVYGDKYCRISHTTPKFNTNNRLVCRILEEDLPVSANLRNYASLCSTCTRLLQVSLPSYSNRVVNAVNWSSAFAGCSNLLYVTNFVNNKISGSGRYFNHMFQGCENLIYTDFRIPADIEELLGIFETCKKFEIDINQVLPEKFTSTNIKISSLFHACYKLYGTIPTHLLWDNQFTQWDVQAKGTISNGDPLLPFTFANKIKNQVPISWGGTASADTIQPSITDKLSTLSDRLDAVEQALGEVSSLADSLLDQTADIIGE